MIQQVYFLTLYAFAIFTFIYGLLSLLIHVPKETFAKGCDIARKMFGVLMLVWSAYLVCHLVFGLRATSLLYVISTNLSIYYLATHLFEIAFCTLLDISQFTRRRLYSSLLKWGLFNIAIITNLLLPISFSAQRVVIIILSIIFFFTVMVNFMNFFKLYKITRIKLENYYSEDKAMIISWMKHCIYGIAAMGATGGFLAFGSYIIEIIYTILGGVMFTYIFLSFVNYIVKILSIKGTLNVMEQPTVVTVSHSKFESMRVSIERWCDELGYVKHGVTIEDLARHIGSNRTYVSSFVNETYHLTFRDWIAQLRVEYSKKVMAEHPEFTTSQISEMVGYARNSYIAAFAKNCGVTPKEWRRSR